MTQEQLDLASAKSKEIQNVKENLETWEKSTETKVVLPNQIKVFKTAYPDRHYNFNEVFSNTLKRK